ncbi:putative DEAD/DEAH box RNA helicase [Tribonema minus]|uniref:RNA helicase n=1 Tax=Tribonema minus TaxID=303371 RepID=A0A835ZDT0_9STRA|nr:putative DEAD/DEAH box RNA helicase [Tribonema minus]
MDYEPFRKDFYRPTPDVAGMLNSEIMYLREELEGLEAPTPIQAQALPVALSGRDLIGVAKTGSGKTFAFVWPVLVHVMAQREIEDGEGPIAVILSPTRELATQIHGQAKKFAKQLGANVCAVFGGAGKWEMQKALREGPEIVVATPGRLIEMIKIKATNLARCTCVVLDEADRMFDLGFGYQMRSIVDQVRPSRQTMLFSATFKRKVEQLARDVLTDPVRINVGHAGAMTSNEDIRQVVHVLPSDAAKWSWLTSELPGFVANGKVLIFVSSRAGCEELCKSIAKDRRLQVEVGSIHGDKDQTDRETTLRAFRQGKINVLVGTDVASRGLDIKDVNTVVSYDMAKNIETHIHRIGRTGRMGKEGVHPGAAYTLFTPKHVSAALWCTSTCSSN